MPDITDADIDNVARTAISEAGEYGDAGMASVAQVARNRWLAGGFGDTPSTVVLAPKQFTAWGLNKKDPNHPNNIPANDPRLAHAKQIVQGVFGGQVPDATNGATFYWDPSARHSAPDFAQGRKPIARVGGHLFYTDPDGGHVPDLLSEWSARPAASASANQPQSASQAPAGDLLGEWATQPEPAAASAAPAVPWQRPDLPHLVVPSPNAPMPAPASASPAAPQAETLGQFIARQEPNFQGAGPLNAAARLGLGALRGFADVPDTAARGIANALSATGLVSPEYAQGVSSRIARDQAAFTPYDTGLSSAGRLVGQIATTGPVVGAVAAPLEAVPYAGSLLGGAATGAGTAALTSAASDQPAGTQIGAGALAGGILGPVGQGISRLGAKLVGSVDPYVARIAQAARDQFGINLSASQISQNPMIRFVDSMLQRIPFTGYGARTAQQKTQFANALAAEMGTSADRITPDVVQSNLKSLGRDYQAWDQRVGPQSIDQTFYNDLKNVKDDADFNLEPAKAKLIDKHIDNVFSKISPHALEMDPEQYRSLTRHGGPLDNAINGDDPGVARRAGQIKKALEDLVGRNDPALKREKDEIDYKYAITKALEKTANKSPTGDLQPKSVFNAIAAGGYSNPATELGRAGQLFLSEPPSSGTAERLLSIGALGKIATGAIAGGLGYGAVHEFDPEDLQTSIAKLGMGAAGLAALRYGVSPALRSSLLANRVIANSLGGGQPVQNLLAGAPTALGAITARNALTNRTASP